MDVKTKMATKLSFAPPLPIKLDMNLFVDRGKEEKIISQALASNRHVLIFGEGGIGKTSLLNKILYTYSGQKNMILVPATALVSRNKPMDLIQLLIFQLHKKLQSRPVEKIRDLIKSISITIPFVGQEISARNMKPQGLSEYELLDRFQDVIISLCKKQFKTVFLIDGLDKDAESFFSFFGQLRDFLWRTRAIFIATGDLEKKGLYLQPPADTFFDVVLELKPFTYKDICKLIVRRSGESVFSQGHLRTIYEVSYGNPREAIRFARATLDRNLSVKEILRIARSEKKIVQGVSDPEKGVIQYLMKQGATYSSCVDLQKALSISRSRLVQIFQELKEKGIVTSFKKGKKQFYIISDKFKERIK